jgi:isoleucyl-tRNA synthetase
MLSSQVVRSEDLRFSENGIKEVLRGVMIPIWNAYSFLVTYANVDHWEPAPGGATPQNLSNPLDRWILSSLTQMTEEIQNEMDNYNLQKAATRFTRFVDDLTNWYIRRSRRRFWKSQNDADKSEAYQTLHYALLTFARTAAPFIPFVTETIYQNLRTEDMPESVHLCDYPQADNSRRDETLEKQMENTMTAARLGRFLRSQSNLKTRQPLAKAVIVAADPETRILLKETADIIGEELNVKEIVFSADENELVTYSAKANFKTLGPKLGKMMKEAANAIQSFSSVEVAAILAGTERQITLSDGNSVAIATSDLDLRREEKPGLTVANEGALTVALDTTLTRSLEEEGFAREFVSRIQNLRKESGLKVSDRIEIAYQVPEEWKSALTNFRDYIASETLAEKVEAADLSGTEPVILNDVSCAVKVSKI